IGSVRIMLRDVRYHIRVNGQLIHPTIHRASVSPAITYFKWRPIVWCIFSHCSHRFYQDTVGIKTEVSACIACDQDMKPFIGHQTRTAHKVVLAWIESIECETCSSTKQSNAA